MPNNELFAEFPPISKADWLGQIAKDLKNRSLEEFEWRVDEDLIASPFVHADDFKMPPAPLSPQPLHWEICESIPVADPATANARAMEALNGGAEGLRLTFDKTPDWPAVEQTLAGIHPDYIALHLAGKGIQQNPSAIFGYLLRHAGNQKLDTAALRGSVEYDPVQSGGIIVDWRYLADLLAFARESLPLFKIISVDFSPDKNPATALSETLKTANQYLQKMSEFGIPPQETARFLQFSVPVGKSYFLEIAKIRALKLLWINVLKGWEAPISLPVVAAHFQAETYTDDLYTNMIRSTTMAMSAVLGGADRLTVLPYDAGRENAATYPASFGRRIARNVQHLLKMESMLEEVHDPVAGSYYIEQLTNTLAEKAWSLFAGSR